VYKYTHTVIRTRAATKKITMQLSPTTESSASKEVCNPLSGIDIAQSCTSIRVYIHPNLPPKRPTQPRRNLFKRSRPASTHTVADDLQKEKQLLQQSARVMIIQKDEQDMNTFLALASTKLQLPSTATKLFVYKGRRGQRVRQLETLQDGDRVFLALYPDERFFRDRPSSMRFQYAMFGASNVGKTALLKRYVTNTFITFYDPSLEEPVKTTRAITNCPCALQILDTGGTKEHVQLSVHRWTKGLNGAVLCFDATRVDSSLVFLEQFVHAMRRHERDSAVSDTSWTQQGCPMVLCACKMDLLGDGTWHGGNGGNGNGGNGDGDSRGNGRGRGRGSGSTSKVDRRLLKELRRKGNQFKEQHGCCAFIETSAADGDGTDAIFATLTTEVLRCLGGGHALEKERLVKESEASRRGGMNRGGGGGVCNCCCWA
jgi:GTPase SAR1 family protein